MLKEWCGLEVARRVHQIVNVAGMILGKSNNALYVIRFVQIGLQGLNIAKRGKFAFGRFQLFR